mmetsp:Transcript_17860/g.29347  ORF Transcript_17860/g.29347 Transcript_17860/m.29347 type:complete len:84 (+) Transcript_17860:555-806(+)
MSKKKNATDASILLLAVHGSTFFITPTGSVTPVQSTPSVQQSLNLDRATPSPITRPKKTINMIPCVIKKQVINDSPAFFDAAT